MFKWTINNRMGTLYRFTYFLNNCLDLLISWIIEKWLQIMCSEKHINSTQPLMLYFDLIMFLGVNGLSHLSFLAQHTLSTVNVKTKNIDTWDLPLFFYNKVFEYVFFFVLAFSDAEILLGLLCGGISIIMKAIILKADVI